MCVLLGDFLRGTLALGAQDRIPLAEEVALVERFLAIERVRFGGRLAAEFDVRPDAAPCLVPPLLLQPLVENAVRHGIAGLVDGGTIRVTAERRADRLLLAVGNPCDPDRRAGGGVGVGLANVRDRMQTAYGHAARVDARERDGMFRVEVSLPIVEAGSEASAS
jgi:two-component system, LytTR family, sensor histidine kinase AlgZ